MLTYLEWQRSISVHVNVPKQSTKQKKTNENQNCCLLSPHPLLWVIYWDRPQPTWFEVLMRKNVSNNLQNKMWWLMCPAHCPDPELHLPEPLCPYGAQSWDAMLHIFPLPLQIQQLLQEEAGFVSQLLSHSRTIHAPTPPAHSSLSRLRTVSSLTGWAWLSAAAPLCSSGLSRYISPRTESHMGSFSSCGLLKSFCESAWKIAFCLLKPDSETAFQWFELSVAVTWWTGYSETWGLVPLFFIGGLKEIQKIK